MFSALGAQLLIAVLHADGIYTCSGCGLPYTPKRRPVADRGHYCRACGRTAAVRVAEHRGRVAILGPP
jgi:hypothetical protein